jgi:predicted metalloendopeptidase
MKRIIGSSAVVALAVLAWQPAATGAEPPRAAIGEWGIETAGMSKTVRPGDDFYRYVNEGWLKTAKIPQGLPATDALTELYLSTEQRVLGIIKETQEGNDAPGTPEQLIADYYRSYADRDRRNALGLTPIAASLGMLMGADTHNDVARAMGFTGDQRFFLSWAQVWRSLVTESEERRRLLSDPHSPGEFRVNGIVRNVDAWYEAFDVKPGDKLYLPPEARVRIW